MHSGDADCSVDTYFVGFCPCFEVQLAPIPSLQSKHFNHCHLYIEIATAVSDSFFSKPFTFKIILDFNSCDRTTHACLQVITYLLSIMFSRLLVRIDCWDVSSNYPSGHLVRSLGAIGELETEMTVILIENRLLCSPFSNKLLSGLFAFMWTVFLYVHALCTFKGCYYHDI